MNLADWVVIMSICLTLAPVVMAVNTKKSDQIIYGDDEILAWLCLLAGAILTGDRNLINSFWFGLIIGIIQPIADLHLTEKTLIYPDKKNLILKTPFWVVCLWCIALAQLCYLWARIDDLMKFFSIPDNPTAKWFLFVTIGFLYFLIFEIIVSNWTDWWRRKNCKKIWGVPIYALCAELATVILLTLFFSPTDTLGRVVISGWINGFVIISIFIVFCKMAYDPKID